VRRGIILGLLLLPCGLPLHAAPDDPAVLQIRIVEGEGAVYSLGSRATRGITVQIGDETGRPVEGAAVSFQLPANGPGGTFSNGARSEIVNTKADGSAAVWGMQWNRMPGAFEVRITAMKGGARAGTVCPQYLSEAKAEPAAVSKNSRSRKWLWIGLAVAAGAGGGAVLAGRSGGSPQPSALASTTIGPPAVALGRP
jgi:hypothetical protein